MLSDRPEVSRQFERYVVVGVASNLLLYALYLLFTALGVGPKVAMSVLYVTGILQTFIVNRRWTFRDRGPVADALVRYSIIYLAGYAVNFAGLFLFVDVLGYMHQIVQGVLIIVVAMLIFGLQRSWVFRAKSGSHGADARQPRPRLRD